MSAWARALGAKNTNQANRMLKQMIAKPSFTV